jgi:hypothetical protein
MDVAARTSLPGDEVLSVYQNHWVRPPRRLQSTKECYTNHPTLHCRFPILAAFARILSSGSLLIVGGDDGKIVSQTEANILLVFAGGLNRNDLLLDSPHKPSHYYLTVQI